MRRSRHQDDGGEGFGNTSQHSNIWNKQLLNNYEDRVQEIESIQAKQEVTMVALVSLLFLLEGRVGCCGRCLVRMDKIPKWDT